MSIIERSFTLGSKIYNKSLWTLSSLLKPTPKIQKIHEFHLDGPNPRCEYLRVVDEPAYIEPEWGHIITTSGVFVEDSLQPNYIFPIPNWRICIPSIHAYHAKRKEIEKNCVHYPVVISLRHLWEWNYYHFYFDVLGKLKLLNDFGFYGDIPIVVGDYATALSWANQVLHMGNFAGNTWVTHNKQYISADKVIYCRTDQYYKERIDFVLDEMGVAQPESNQNKRYFLNRGENSVRHLLNLEEIKPILDAYNFEIIDTDGKSIAEQVALFAKARYVVAIHGAGVTNIIFRRDAPLSLLELHPRGLLSVDFKKTCVGYGHDYFALECEPEVGVDVKHTSFTVDPDKFVEMLERMVVPSKIV